MSNKPLSELVRTFLLTYHDSKVRDDDDLEIAYVAGFKAARDQVIDRVCDFLMKDTEHCPLSPSHTAKYIQANKDRILK